MIKHMRLLRNSFHLYLRRFSSNKVEDNLDAPIKFTTSQASKRGLQPMVVSNPHYDDMPWYQPNIVSGSVAVFMIYFCILRESNDIDEEFEKTLYDRMEGLEKHQLLQAYKFNREHGKSVEDIEKRLREIEQEEANARSG